MKNILINLINKTIFHTFMVQKNIKHKEILFLNSYINWGLFKVVQLIYISSIFKQNFNCFLYNLLILLFIFLCDIMFIFFLLSLCYKLTLLIQRKLLISLMKIIFLLLKVHKDNEEGFILSCLPRLDLLFFL